ncbi:GNAT family N-acetyltransferase [Aquabacterium sp. OR-4]|uniref:GNAT family N-acetyltransferase n=1 Tax=Aquabacterium sp. OR-4 TaxID=2978127 RepID=UPI0021B44D97|nr:GNAT family N-acetyltransferase [Aquabacterium sp. OR-4]MDT7836100.1 GNAT family N-acetyltransferase [Aquabacterium sp. OR-4]
MPNVINADVVIRPERADQPDVMALLDALDTYLNSLYDPADNHILGVQALLAPDVLFLVARHRGQAVACGAARRMPGEAHTDGQAYGEIKRMYVDPAARGQGLALALIEALEAHLRQQGIAQALLETGAAQQEAVRLYQRCGYRPRAAFGGYPDNGLSVFYGKRL